MVSPLKGSGSQRDFPASSEELCMLGEDLREDHTGSIWGWPLGAKSDPCLTASKRIETSFLQINTNTNTNTNTYKGRD